MTRGADSSPATATKAGHLRGLPLGILDGGAYEEDVRAVGEIRDERLGERKGPRWFVAKLMSHPCAFFVGLCCWIPALLMRPAIESFSAAISAAARRALVGSDRSQTTDTAWWPWPAIVFCKPSSLARSRPTRTTVPCFASSSAARCP